MIALGGNPACDAEQHHQHQQQQLQVDHRDRCRHRPLLGCDIAEVAPDSTRCKQAHLP